MRVCLAPQRGLELGGLTRALWTPNRTTRGSWWFSRFPFLYRRNGTRVNKVAERQRIGQNAASALATRWEIVRYEAGCGARSCD
jgi:hypothetical protein